MTLRMVSDAELPANNPACYVEDKRTGDAVILVSENFDGDAVMLAAVVDRLLVKAAAVAV